jgi:hypothetical protein
MEADGLEEIETSNASADAGDYYLPGATFGPYSTPNSSRYGGLDTGMGIMDIANVAGGVRFTVFSSDAPPGVEITDPAAGETVYGTVPVGVTANDDHGIDRVELYTGTTLRQTLTAPPYTFALDTTALANGAQDLRAVAYDSILQTSQDTVSVVVENIFAPSGLAAVRAANRSLLIREYVNVLTWSHDTRNTTVSAYRVYQVTAVGRVLLGEVARTASATSFRYLHRGVSGTETYTYEVVGVGNLDREGAAASATVR